MIEQIKNGAQFQNDLYMEKKISVCVTIAILFYLDCQDLNSETDTTFVFTKKNKALCGFNPQLFFLKKTSFPHLKTKQSKTFQDIYEKKAPCASKILAFDTKKNLGLAYSDRHLLRALKLAYAMFLLTLSY